MKGSENLLLYQQIFKFLILYLDFSFENSFNDKQT